MLETSITTIYMTGLYNCALKRQQNNKPRQRHREEVISARV